MSARRVKWFGKKQQVSEIYQQFGMVFSFVNTIDDGLVQCHQWIKCRDFLHDALRTALTGKQSSIYGFVFTKGKNPDINLDRTMMLISEPNITDARAFRKILTRSLRLVHHYENMIGESLSRITKVSPDTENGYKHAWLIEGSKFWISAPHLISLYTLLLRLGGEDIKVSVKEENLLKSFDDIIKNKKDQLTNDTKYLKTVGKYIGPVLKLNSEIVKYNDAGFSLTYFDEIPINSFHNSSGIFSLCGMRTWSKDLNDIIKEKINK